MNDEVEIITIGSENGEIELNDEDIDFFAGIFAPMLLGAMEDKL